MKLAVMQPYFLPYIGYWQLMAEVDKYIILDDVNYIRGGWINRNRILVNGNPWYMTMPLSKASQNKKINELDLLEDKKQRNRLLSTITASYAKAPHYGTVFPLLERIIRNEEKNLTLFLLDHHRIIADYLGINTKLLLSSSLEKDNSLKGEDRILSICQLMGADEYYNPIGGISLYSKERFAENGIQLYFLQTGDVTYRQFGQPFVPLLSILDVMMFNSVEKIHELLNMYDLC